MRTSPSTQTDNEMLVDNAFFTNEKHAYAHNNNNTAKKWRMTGSKYCL